MKKAIPGGMIMAVTMVVNAGDWGKTPIDKTPIMECVEVGGEVSVGYLSDYIFYGIKFAGDSVWTEVNHTFDGLAIPITIGAWYLNGVTDGGGGFGAGPGYDELDLHVSAALGTYAGFEGDLGYTHYIFPEFRSNVSPVGSGYGELGLDISRSLGIVDLAFQTNYALGGAGNASGWYHQLGIEKRFMLTDGVGLVLGAGLGYSDGYFVGSGWNHYYAMASLPISLNCRTTLTPYLGYSGAPDTWMADGIIPTTVGVPQSDILHGGVTLSVTF